MGNGGGTERVTHTMMVQMLSMVLNERQDNWDKLLLHDEDSAYNNSVSAATDFGPERNALGSPDPFTSDCDLRASWRVCSPKS